MIKVQEAYKRILEVGISRRGWTHVDVCGEVASAWPGRMVLAVVHWTELESAGLAEVIALRKALEGVPIVVIASSSCAELAFRLGRVGVADLIDSSLDPALACERCLDHARIEGDAGAVELAGDSPPMRDVRRAVLAAAGVRSTVLVTGETGTGKTLIAREIHRCSSNGSGPLLHVDCTVLSPSLIESELFGHERGAFTGALSARAGRFETAGDGDILLDEIGDLDPGLQAKFLRVIEDREFERVGGSRTLRMRARVIAATNRRLADEVRAGRFRADLYHRLGVLKIQVPPLRERSGDVPALCETLLARLASQLEVPAPPLSNDALDTLGAHGWPGNVRELRNLLEAILVHHRPMRVERRHVEELLHEASCQEEGMPEQRRSAAFFEATRQQLTDDASAERSELIRLLAETGGNVSRVARRAGLPRSTLRHRIHRHGLESYIARD